MRILLVDNYDSFTFNLYQLFALLGAEVIVMKSDLIDIAGAKRMRPTHIVISPGPGTPKTSGNSRAILREMHGVVPILGVCLGHQCIGAEFSSDGEKNVGHAPELLHGKISQIRHDGAGILRGVPSPFSAARYHSLIVRKAPQAFRVMAWTKSKTGKRLIMGLMHERFPTFGVQFHPESFLTEHGKRIARNFLACAAATFEPPLR